MAAPHRNLVLCLDGTDNSFDDSVSNIVKLYALLEKQNTGRQLSYYQAGIRTYLTPGFWKDMASHVACWTDSALAAFLDAHIIAAYKFLMNNHQQGDRIFLFGFSRGAYVARCLAGMLHKVGLLTQANQEQLGFAYKAYVDTSEVGKARSERFKKTFSKVVDVEFMGCWDTVASVGRFYGRDLPFSNSNRMVKVFRHALALDERRVKFIPTLWHLEPSNPVTSVKDPNNPFKHADRTMAADSYPRCSAAHLTHGFLGLSGKKVRGNVELKGKAEQEQARRGKEDKVYDPNTSTDVLEVWFAGCHADVGGGSEDTTLVKPSLSRPSLRWMLCQAIPKGLMLNLDEDSLITLGLDKNSSPRNSQLSTDGEMEGGPSASSPGSSGDLAQGSRSNDTVVSTDPSPSGSEPMHHTYRSSSLTKTATASMKRAHKKELENISDDMVERMVAEIEAENEGQDIKGLIHDQLRIKWWFWGFLELIPFKRNYQDGEGCWHKERRWNRGKPREIFVKNPDTADYVPPNFHFTVAERAKATNYQHKAKFVYMNNGRRRVALNPSVNIVYDS